MFSLKLTARPDARMVEVPLEIEAELPREFDGAALLASSGLPRRVRLRAAKDALKLSTAYRADRLVGDIVRGALRGTAADVQRVQDAVMKFVRAVRERRQDGATLVVSSNGRGKIEVVEVPGSRPPVPSAPLQPYETTRPPATQERAAPDRVALLEHRVTELEAALARVGGGDLVERLAQVEQKLAPVTAQVTRAIASAEIAGPGQENGSTARPPRRVTALDSYVDGLRGDLRSRASAAAARVKTEAERCDRAAALAADAEQLGVPPDGTTQQLREAAAQVAERQTALERLAEEIEFYPAAELAMAGPLLARLEEAATRDPAPLLEPKAETIVRAAKGDKRADGTPIVEARVKVEPGASERDTKRLSFPPPRPAEPAQDAVEPAQDAVEPAQDAVEPAQEAEPSPPPPAVEALATAVAAAPDPAPAIPTQPPVATPLPEVPTTQPFALLPPAAPSSTLASVPEETAIAGEDAALAATHALRIVAEDPAANDEALALVEGALGDRASETPKSDG